jgi:cupin 2 domain-containing protein
LKRFGRGRLLSPADAPQVGERHEEIAHLGEDADLDVRAQVVVEQILSGALPSPVDFDQAYDEWVVVLDGHALLEVGEERVHLVRGDWVLLPAHTPHLLVETEPGTNWLAVRVR